MKDLFFFVKLFKPYSGWLISGTVLALLTSLASISLLTLSGWFITSSAIAGLLAPDGVAVAFNFMQPAAEIRALAIIRTFGRYAERVVTHEATFRVLAEIRSWFFLKLIPLSPGQLAAHRSADLLNGITQDIDVLDALYLRLCSPFLVAFIASIAVIFFVALYSLQISILLGLMLGLAILVIPCLIFLVGKKGSKAIVEQAGKFKIEQIELLDGIADLTIFNAYQRYKRRVTHVSEIMIETGRKNNQLSAVSSFVSGFLAQATLLVSIVFAALLFQQGVLTGAVLVMISFCVWAVFELVSPLSSSIQLLAKTQTAARKIRNITEQKPLINNPIVSKSKFKTAEIKINGLSFRYPGCSEWALKNINLTIPEGSKIAITGKSGAGKSTLLKLMLRYFDPQQGSVKYSGVEYTHIKVDHIMAQFSVLSQQTQLFSASIKENLLIAKPNASMNEISQAIRMAGLSKFIGQLPNGINTWVGKNGEQVSTGEARRIALARVYLKNSPILLLDEPTEGLDKRTEEEVLNALEIIAKNKTLIMVTHKTAALRLVDQVYNMESLNCLRSRAEASKR